MDANRARCPCCEPPPAGGTTAAHGAWDAYHGWLEEALRAAVERHGFCLLLDIHGQSHRKGVTELGYLLTSDDLLLSDDAIDRAPPRPSSVDALLRGAAAEQPGGLAALVRGPASLGGLLERAGFPCVPSPSSPQPVAEEALRAAQASKADIKAALGPPAAAVAAATYFWGAYTIRRYGAAATTPADGNPVPGEGWARHVSAVQLETSWDGVRDSQPNREAFGQALCASALELLRAWRRWAPT